MFNGAAGAAAFFSALHFIQITVTEVYLYVPWSGTMASFTLN